MKHVHLALAVVASMFLLACSQTKKASGGPNQPKVTASGYTKEGCLLNLKLEARERNVRLVPDDLEVETNALIFLFPFLDQDGYRCSGSYIKREKRPSGKDPLYPIE